MKLKPTFLLATFVVTIGLLLGASTAQAVNVITDGDGNVTRIENLPVIDETTEEPTIYNVDFRYESAIDVYGSGLVTDFPPPDGDETIILALEAVMDALNAEDPTPPGAGPEGTDQFFIGYKEEDGVFVSVGGENFSGVWDFCATDCINVGEIKTGVTTMSPGDLFTYADFTMAQDVAPGKATLISPSGTITENTPTYTWNAVANSTWYQLQVNDSAQNEKILEWYTADEAGCGGGTGECSVTPSTEIADGAAKWWIQTWNDFGDEWSDKLKFTVDNGTGVPPEKATLISPSGTITENTPTYTWNAVANSSWYQLQVNDSAQKGKILEWYTADEAGCGGGTGECSITPGTELADGAAKWWIQTWNDFGEEWSDELEFTVDIGTSVPPGKATLISPSGTITDNTPTYTWNAVASSTWYRIQVNDSAQKEKILEWYTADEAGCGGGTGECSITPGTELADGAAKWWIQTWNDFGDEWSDKLEFTVNSDAVDPGVNVILDGNNVIRIENLPVVDENTGDITIYDVEFVFDTASNVYGSSLDFDFPDDETIFVALNAVLDALNFNNPTPVGAGPQSSDDFFIGNKEEDGLVVAVGGENFSGVWDPCATNCINVGEIQTGVTLLPPGDSFTYADFTEAD